MKKIKLFVGGVVNVSNAQNINCRSIINYIDKSKFELYTLQSSRFEVLDNIEAKYVVISEPIKIFKYLAFLWGIIKADVCYFPKTECMTWNFIFCKLLNKKYFRTIETIFDYRLEKSLADSNRQYVIEDYKKSNNLFSITSYMKTYNYKHHGIESKKEILYLGVDDGIDSFNVNIVKNIKNVIIIGHDLKRKGLEDFLELSKLYGDICFHVVGGNSIFDSRIKNEHENVIFHGTLERKVIHKLLNDIDVLILPSHSEGFPKVILECAARGVPSLIYSSYGANEWIDSDHNGFICDSKNELFDKFKQIKRKPELIENVKSNLQDLVLKFQWSKQISNWEAVIKTIYNS